MKIIKISEPVFRTHLTIFIGKDYVELRKYFDDESIDIFEDSIWLYIRKDGIYNSILLKSNKIPHFIHELSHFIHKDLSDKNIKDDETIAYMMEFYTTEYLKNR